MKEFPVVRVTLLFAAGIILQSFFSLTLFYNITFLLLLLFLSFFAFIHEKKHSRSYGAASILLLLLSLSAGYSSGQLQRQDRSIIPDSIYVVKDFTAYGRIEEIDLPSKDGFSFLLKTDSIKAGRTVNAGVALYCTLWDDSTGSLFARLEPGNKIIISGTYRKGREERNPGEFDYNKYLHSQNISGMLSVYDKKDLRVISGEVNYFKSVVFSIRKYIDKIIVGLHSPESAALLEGLILADRRDIDYETRTHFVNSGVVHILAVSGLHTGFIALIFFVFFGRLNFYGGSILTISGLILFMLITGIPASVFRAVVMAVVLIIAFISSRSTNIYNSLAIAALILLTVDPSEIFNPGFQLSFISVLSIAYFYPRFKVLIDRMEIKTGFLKYVILLSAVSLSAQIGTLPVTLMYFGKFSLIALPVNLVVIPLAGIIIGTAITTLFFFPFSLWAASVYASANNMFASFLYTLVKFGGSFRFSSLDVINYSQTDVIIFYLFTVGAVFIVRYLNSSRAVLIFIFLIAGNIYVFSSTENNPPQESDKLNVLMLDVGQGDSFILKFPGGKTALIDAGNASRFFDSGERIIMPAMRKLGIEKFDYGFVSHIDADHYGGFVSLIDKGMINKIFKPFPDTSYEKDTKFERYLKNKNIPVEYYSRRKIRIGNAEVFILNDTPENLAGGNSLNNSSGIIKMAFGKTSFLFTGDIDRKGENYYTRKYKNFLHADVLKVSHHGSKSGSSYIFVQTVSPEISLVSCGIKNRFGHPAREVTERLRESGSVTLRTDRLGCIMLQSDGMKISRIDWRKYY